MNEKINIFNRIGQFIAKILHAAVHFLYAYVLTPIGHLFAKLWEVKFFRIANIAIWKGIKWLVHYLLLPFKLLKRGTYDKFTYNGQKVFMSFLFLTPVLIGFLVFFIYPLVMSAIYSLSEIQFPGNGIHIAFGGYDAVKGDPSTFVPDLFHNFKYALSQHATFPVELANTVKNTVIDVVVITIFSLLVAVMLNGKFKGRGLVRSVFFLPVIFNSEAIRQAVNRYNQVDGLLNQMGNGALAALFNLEMFLTSAGIPVWLITFLTSITTAIYNTISYSGIQILIFLAAIQSVPAHLYEAAKIEGATKYESFWKITLPMVSPMIMTVVVFTIVDSFMRSPINTTIDMVYGQANYGLHAAMLWLYMGASILILVIFVGLLSKVVFYYDEK